MNWSDKTLFVGDKAEKAFGMKVKAVVEGLLPVGSEAISTAFPTIIAGPISA